MEQLEIKREEYHRLKSKFESFEDIYGQKYVIVGDHVLRCQNNDEETVQ